MLYHLLSLVSMAIEKYDTTNKSCGKQLSFPFSYFFFYFPHPFCSFDNFLSNPCNNYCKTEYLNYFHYVNNCSALWAALNEIPESNNTTLNLPEILLCIKFIFVTLWIRFLASPTNFSQTCLIQLYKNQELKIHDLYKDLISCTLSSRQM